MTDFPPDYCPYCGTELRDDGPKHRCPDCGSGVFHSPAVAAAVAVVDSAADDTRVLLGERGVAPAEGRLSTPGGHVDFGENPRTAAARELEEETGLRVDPDDLEPIRTRLSTGPERNHASVHFAVGRDAATGEPVAGDDAAKVAFLTPTEYDGREAVSHDGPTLADAVSRF